MHGGTRKKPSVQWKTLFGASCRAEILLSWETMRTCLDGYWMGNRRPTNTHILRSALRNSQTKKNAFNNARHRGNGFPQYEAQGRSRRASCVYALRTRDAFPGNIWTSLDVRNHVYREPVSEDIGWEATGTSIHVLCPIFPNPIISSLASWSSHKYSLGLCKPPPAVGNGWQEKRNSELLNILTKGQGTMEIF